MRAALDQGAARFVCGNIRRIALAVAAENEDRWFVVQFRTGGRTYSLVYGTPLKEDEHRRYVYKRKLGPDESDSLDYHIRQYIGGSRHV